jgi:hypothetical protein
VFTYDSLIALLSLESLTVLVTTDILDYPKMNKKQVCKNAGGMDVEFGMIT